MLKEIKYLVLIAIISIFIFFTGKYYFSDENIKHRKEICSIFNNEKEAQKIIDIIFA